MQKTRPNEEPLETVLTMLPKAVRSATSNKNDHMN